MVVGGPAWYVAWTVLAALVSLFAFAAALEGFMFTTMYWFNRLLVGAGLVLIFYPVFAVEAAGMAVMLLVLLINWLKRRREQRAEAAETAGAG